MEGEGEDEGEERERERGRERERERERERLAEGDVEHGAVTARPGSIQEGCARRVSTSPALGVGAGEVRVAVCVCVRARTRELAQAWRSDWAQRRDR
jgi:hypothetical protein